VIVVTGQIRVSDRSRFLALSRDAMKLARETDGCLDFVVAADPLEEDRINVLELWMDRESLLSFRGGGPGDDLSAMIESADVKEYDVIPASP
jgi:quinol monooxygenase YgiN